MPATPPITVDLSGKVAVVTGGTGVLGSEFSRALAANGAAVAVIGRNQAKADAIAKDIANAGGSAIAIKCDVLDKEALRSAHERIRSELGPCDILVNGAGGNHPKGTTSGEYLTDMDLQPHGPEHVSFFDLEADGIRHVLDLNFLGALLTTQEFAKDMVDRPGGSVLNISSMNAFTPLTKIPAYSAAKAAVTNLTQWLAVHFAPVGVRVNAIAPGFFATEQNQKLLFEDDGELTARSRKILSATPMRRFGEPSELLGALLFLASDNAAGFVSGVTVPVDGAFSAYSGV
ncbi:SDR family oxidoreductase (plasmid) [Arthrobacter sp. UC242_113]|uniref:SDR family oxidoreductase n=1 Tax=Arthrobacter sp. UC242_113 TaxID=3374550 RepID=UPI003757C31C